MPIYLHIMVALFTLNSRVEYRDKDCKAYKAESFTKKLSDPGRLTCFLTKVGAA